jgi:hypothetical protein
MKDSKAQKIREAVEQIIRQNGQIGPEDIMGLCSEFSITENEFYELDEPKPNPLILLVGSDGAGSVINSLRILRALREAKKIFDLPKAEQVRLYDEAIQELETQFKFELKAVDDYLKETADIAVDKKEEERQRKLRMRHRKQKRGKK